jgi:transposase
VIDAMVKELDLGELESHYHGVGSQPHPPELMLKIALYETVEGKRSPAVWARDARESHPVQWLALGIQPSRSAMDPFRDRLQPVIEAVVADRLGIAQEEGSIRTRRGVRDGTAIRAQGSRHHRLNQSSLNQRIEALQRAVTADAAGQVVAEHPAWMAQTAKGRREQLQRHLEADAVLRHRLAEKAKKPSDRRLDPKQVRVCVSDPEAPLGRDKEEVFCPLYTAEVIIEPSSWLVVAFDVFAQATDAGARPPMLDPAKKRLDQALETIITDAG